jgi:hypothetical protein
MPFGSDMKTIQVNTMKMTYEMGTERTKNFSKGVHGVPPGGASISFSGVDPGAALSQSSL